MAERQRSVTGSIPVAPALPVRERYHKLSDIKSKNTPNIWLVSVQGEVAQPGAVVGIHRNTSGALLRESGEM